MRVLFATDGSKDARAAAAYLKELPLPPATTVRIVVAVTLPGFSLEEPAIREFKRSVLEEARDLADEARAVLVRRELSVETDVVVGDPRAEIVRLADEWRADLIVLGARGLGRIKRLLLGSVSLAVARHASCPVLVVKGRQTPTTIYEVFVEEPGPAASEWLQAFDAAVAAYVAGDFVTAQRHLSRAQSANPDDAVTSVLARRCRQLSLRDLEWAGAWELGDK